MLHSCLIDQSNAQVCFLICYSYFHDIAIPVTVQTVQQLYNINCCIFNILLYNILYDIYSVTTRRQYNGLGRVCTLCLAEFALTECWCIVIITLYDAVSCMLRKFHLLKFSSWAEVYAVQVRFTATRATVAFVLANESDNSILNHFKDLLPLIIQARSCVVFALYFLLLSGFLSCQCQHLFHHTFFGR